MIANDQVRPVPRLPYENRDYLAGTGTASLEPGLPRPVSRLPSENRDYHAGTGTASLEPGLPRPVLVPGLPR
ncbi:MAG TPA: hypothetical protein VF352_08145 [Anaerolineales bacterium]